MNEKGRRAGYTTTCFIIKVKTDYRGTSWFKRFCDVGRRYVVSDYVITCLRENCNSPYSSEGMEAKLNTACRFREQGVSPPTKQKV